MTAAADILIAFFLGVAVGAGLLDYELHRRGWRPPQRRHRGRFV